MWYSYAYNKEIEEIPALDYAKRTGSPPYIRQMMGLSKNNHNMSNTTVYKAKKPIFDDVNTTGPEIRAFYTNATTPESENFGLEPPFILMNKNENLGVGSHELSHAATADHYYKKDPELKNNSENDKMFINELNHTLDVREILSYISVIILYIYNNPKITLPEVVSKIQGEIPSKEHFFQDLKLVLFSVLWDKIKEIYDRYDIKEIVKNRIEIAEYARSAFVKKVMPYLSKLVCDDEYFTFSDPESFLNSVKEISPFETRYILKNIEQDLYKIPQKVINEIYDFEAKRRERDLPENLRNTPRSD